jgi:hypothetical protein
MAEASVGVVTGYSLKSLSKLGDGISLAIAIARVP